jgi:hypothetical protein
MHLEEAKAALAPIWILTAGIVGILGNVTSVRGGALVLGFGLIPPILMMLRWSPAAQPTPMSVRSSTRLP